MTKRVTAVCVIFLIILVTGSCASTPPRDIGSVDRTALKDGVYEGSFREGPVKAVVKVTVENQRITGIELIEHQNWRGEKAEVVIINRIVTEQSTEVDAVSGATQSSRVIMNAVQSALDEAGK